MDVINQKIIDYDIHKIEGLLVRAPKFLACQNIKYVCMCDDGSKYYIKQNFKAKEMSYIVNFKVEIKGVVYSKSSTFPRISVLNFKCTRTPLTTSTPQRSLENEAFSIHRLDFAV